MLQLSLLILSFLTFSSLYAAPTTAALFNDTSSWYHWGCTGTSTALKEYIEKLGVKVEAIPITTTYSLLKVPPFEEFDSLERFDRFQKANKTVMKQIQRNEMILITGEGTIHDLRKGPKALLYLAHICKKFLNKHVEIINHSAYPKDDLCLSKPLSFRCNVDDEKARQERSKAQLLYQKIYNEVDFVAIREPISYDVMSQLNVFSTLSFDCLPLYINDHYHTPKNVHNKTVVVAGSAASTQPGAKQICRYLEYLDSIGYHITAVTGAAAFASDDEEDFITFLRSELTIPLHVVTAASIDEWLDTINNASFLVSGRFHHSIAAFCLNTPFIALNSNTHKVHGICAFLQQMPPLLFSDPNLFEHLCARTDAIAKAPYKDTQPKVAELCHFAEKNFEGLKNYLKKK